MKLAFFIVWLIVFSSQNFAQTTLKGMVRDQNGANVRDAIVRLTCADSDVYATQADEEGNFSVPRRGKCVLEIRADGFAVYEQTLDTNKADNLSVTLEIESLRLTVTAETGRAENRENVPQAVTIIDAEKFTRRAPVALAQIADEEVGVSFQRTSPTIGAIAVRGLTGKNVSVYVDGVRYTNSAQRGGINTFFNLNEPSNLASVEILRGANSAQYGSDSLGGTVNLTTKTPVFSDSANVLKGEFSANSATADWSAGGNLLLAYGNEKLNGAINLAGRRVSNLRTANGVDSHSALTRFLGLPSTIFGERQTDTAFTQYGGALRLNYLAANNQQIIFSFQRNQQDGGKRFDQLIGGDGNLIADLRNLQTNFGYVRYLKQKFGVFDNASFAVSYNSQREQRVNQGGQGNPFADVVNQYERTSAKGFNFFVDKVLPHRNNLLIGGDFYFERITSPAFNFSPVTRTATASRPRVPNRARFVTSGLYVQNVWQAIPERLRVSGAIRYNTASYRASESPLVNGRRLWADDSLRVGDFSGRIGAVANVYKGLNVAFNYSRGFRYPSMTDLGTLGITGDGFEIDFQTARDLGGTIGTTADADAVSTGLPVARQRSEFSNNYDVSLRYSRPRFDTDLTAFYFQLKDTITKQALILPLGAVGDFLGGERIERQNPNGTVFVAASTAPVLVRANYTSATLYGFEYEIETMLTKNLEFRGNFTYIRAVDDADGKPPNIEGGTPPPQGFAGFRYTPNDKLGFEIYSTFATRQNRLSSLDLADRRTGATRSRSQIQNFFRRGACVRGLTNKADGVCGTGDETILLPTGETLSQVQNRVLGVGVQSAPMFTFLPSFALFNLRGNWRVSAQTSLNWSFENIFDRFHRKPSWGIDGAGRSFKIGYRVSF